MRKFGFGWRKYSVDINDNDAYNDAQAKRF